MKEKEIGKKNKQIEEQREGRKEAGKITKEKETEDWRMKEREEEKGRHERRFQWTKTVS